MNTYIVDESNQKKSVVVPFEEYEQLQQTLHEYKNRLEELEDELDLKLAKETIKTGTEKIPFEIDRESVKLLHTNGLIKDEGEGFVTFWVPFYKKRLYNAFYPYTNGEKADILRSIAVSELFDANNILNLDKLITGTAYPLRSFSFFIISFNVLGDVATAC